MAATSDQEMESLLSAFDQIYEDFKSGITEIQLLKSNCDAEMKRREALEITCNNLKQDNERLSKLHSESLNNLADQLERCTKFQSLREELKRVTDEYQTKEDEYMKAIELFKQESEKKVAALETKISCFLVEKAANESTINHLHQDILAHKSHIQALANRLERIHFDLESEYHLQIQDLRDCLLIEQEEKTDLNKKVQNLEKELLISRTKLVEQQRDLSSDRHVESRKLKMMKLRKENEVLKRKLIGSQEG